MNNANVWETVRFPNSDITAAWRDITAAWRDITAAWRDIKTLICGDVFQRRFYDYDNLLTT